MISKLNRKELITDIGERLTDAIYELNDSFEWDYDDDRGSRSHSCTACIKYEYGGKEYDVQVWACWPHIGDSSLEVEISGGKGKAGRWKFCSLSRNSHWQMSGSRFSCWDSKLIFIKDAATKSNVSCEGR